MFKSLEELVKIIRERKKSSLEKSYTIKLLKDKISCFFDFTQKKEKYLSTSYLFI